MYHVVHFNFRVLDHQMEHSSVLAIREDEDALNWLVIVIKIVTSGDW